MGLAAGMNQLELTEDMLTNGIKDNMEVRHL